MSTNQVAYDMFDCGLFNDPPPLSIERPLSLSRCPVVQMDGSVIDVSLIIGALVQRTDGKS